MEYEYGNGLVIEVLLNGELIETFPFNEPADLGLHTTECAANNYYYQNRTVHWVMTNMPDCAV